MGSTTQRAVEEFRDGVVWYMDALGNRTATLGCPEVTRSGIIERLGKTKVSGPGQNARINRRAAGLISATVAASAIDRT